MLDVGAGAGIYGRPFAEHFPSCLLFAVEIRRPYIRQFRLDKIYDRVIHDDVRTICWPEVDVVILGDVLEHMAEEEAVDVWAKARDSARLAVYLSIPIIHYPQGEYDGNPYEAHVADDYTHERVLETFPGVALYRAGSVVGTYEALT